MESVPEGPAGDDGKIRVEEKMMNAFLHAAASSDASSLMLKVDRRRALITTTWAAYLALNDSCAHVFCRRPRLELNALL